MLRARLSGLTEAILRINEHLEFDTAAQEVVDSARTLTGARYAMLSTVDDAKGGGGGAQDLLLSGFSEEDRQTLLRYGAGVELFTHLNELPEPLKTGNFSEYAVSHGFGGFELAIGPLLSSRITVRERQVGSLYVSESSGSDDFTQEDEEILELFASQAALALTNARRHGDERRAKDDIEALERLHAEFLAMVSHELRGPLTSIKGSAATMRNASIPPDAAEVHQFFCIVEEQADAMRDLINDLLDMTRIETGMMSVTREPVDVASVIGQARNALFSAGHRHGIEIELAPNLPLVWGDRTRITQVLVNLLSNAAASSPDWSTISVSASLDDAQVTVSVSDAGVGIAPEQLPLLFTKFSRGVPDAAGAGGSGRSAMGHGLGLAICKGIVEAHGGRIWADSAGPDRGARFTFSVPALVEPAAVAVRPDVDEGRVSQVPARVERILAVDDDPQAFRFIRTTLQRAGYTPVVTADPSEAGHLLEAEQPHLVLLDVVLPGTDGFDLVKRIPRMLEVPVIFMSGRGDDRFIARAFELGATDYIVKPFSPTELLVRISAALRRHAQTQHVDGYRVADLTVDYLMRTVTVAGRPVNITPTEYQLLAMLCTNAPRALSYDQLLTHLWGESAGGGAQRVRSLVKDLRAKLGDDARNPSYILTVPNVGYSAATA